MKTYTYYAQLKKPSWAPPASWFGPVWTVLYVLIALSFGFVFVRAAQGSIPALVALPFVLNLLFNLAFTPIQFGLKNNVLAAVDILLVLATLVWAMIAVYPYAALVALVQTPYLLWVAFATVLQFSVTYLNRA